MNKTNILALAVLTALGIGVLIGRASSDSTDGAVNTSAGGERRILYWVAPMDPNYRRDEPGKSPMGMDLVPVYEDEGVAKPGVVSIDPTIVNNLGVRSEKAQFGLLPRKISTVGYVGYDENTVHHVHTRVEGWIEKLVTKTSGDPVTKGQLLFELYSRTLVNAQEEYLAALRSNNKPLLKASVDRLQAFGVGPREIARLEKEKAVRQRVPVYAEIDGVIANLGVREGIFVTPATEIMSVAKLDSIWVLAEVFERQAAWVRTGQAATVELDYLPGKTWNGVVDYVYPELNPVTRTLKVRIRFENDDATLRPNMFSRVTIQGDGFGEVVHVPREAVIRGGSVDRVVIAMGNGRFRVQPVNIGIESGDRIAIRSGLNEGDDVVVSAQFLIDSESNIAAALSRLESSQ
ncbi:MAG: efflux RND transporter periplasmic adaptor subunit [Gammaproteobacteria bacterium]|nr:efflux RND transporter periplasmic adaptor subunit [Gammaproteobacteria bacterium]